MRIIAGEYRGRSLQALPGSITRPTTDRVKEAWASTLASILQDGFVDKCVLDAFAGSGALGLEALSRGARSCVFFEQNRRAFSVLHANVSIVTSTAKCVVLHAEDVTRAVLRAEQQSEHKKEHSDTLPFDLVILDPPYDSPVKKIEGLIRALISQNLLADNAIISYEHRSGDNRCLRSLDLLARKTYGTTTLEYYRFCHLSA